jgi:hypothetical protein
MKLLAERVAVNARQANLSVQLLSHTAGAGSAAGAPAGPAGLHLFAWHYDSLSPRAELQKMAQYLHAEAGAEVGNESNSREKLFADERQLLETRRVLPLLVLPEYVGIAANVRNWSAAPDGEWRLADVWLDTEQAGASNGDAGGGRGIHP